MVAERSLLVVTLLLTACSSGGGDDSAAPTLVGAGAGGQQGAGSASGGAGGLGAGGASAGSSAAGGSGTGGGVDAAAPEEAAGGGGNGGVQEAPALVEGCDGAALYATPDDPAQRGPWPVGVRTAKVGDLTVEVWYPAQLGSEAGVDAERYDVRQFLPATEAAKISDDDSPVQPCNCLRDLPLDADHGPYPAVIYIHGTAGFRTASLAQVSHWASRGFVVVATDHHGLYLADMLAAISFGACMGSGKPQNLAGDVDAMIAALTPPSADLAFLADRVDMTRIAITGHSAGASAASTMGDKPGVQLLMPMAGGAAVASTATLFVSGMADAVVPYTTVKNAYDGSAAPKRMVGIANTGHLVMTELCGLRNAAGEDLVSIAQAAGVCSAGFASALFDCKATYLDQAEGTAIVNYATTAALEESLHCRDRAAAFDALEGLHPDVSELLEQP